MCTPSRLIENSVTSRQKLRYPFGYRKPKGDRKEVIDLIKKQQIILRHVNNDSNRQIAKDLGINKNTVNKYVNEYEEQLKAVIEQEPGTDPNTLITTIVEKPAYNCKNRGPKASTTEAQEVIRKCLAENEEKRLTGRSKQQM